MLTSDYHMRRARAIATLVFGSIGIAVTPVALPFPAHLIQPESKLRITRDCIRSLILIVTGRTGASLNAELKSQSIFIRITAIDSSPKRIS